MRSTIPEFKICFLFSHARTGTIPYKGRINIPFVDLFTRSCLVIYFVGLNGGRVVCSAGLLFCSSFKGASSDIEGSSGEMSVTWCLSSISVSSARLSASASCCFNFCSAAILGKCKRKWMEIFFSLVFNTSFNFFSIIICFLNSKTNAKLKTHIQNLNDNCNDQKVFDFQNAIS